MSEHHGNLDIYTRIRINEIVGYRSQHMSMPDLFDKLGMDYYNRRDYSVVIAIIQKDRCDFCEKIWNVAKDMLCEHTTEKYTILYKLCLRRWYKSDRTLLYRLGDGWGTPMDYNTFKQLEEEFARRDVQTIVNKVRMLEFTNIELPYSLDVDRLETEIKKTKEIEDKSEDVLLDDFEEDLED